MDTSNNVVVIPEKRPNIISGGRPKAIIPQTMDEIVRLAKIVSDSGMAPKGMEDPRQITIAIMHGLEIGLAPMTALQRIAVINGRPTIWGDAAIGLVRGSGLCEYVKEWADEKGTAYCETKRKFEPEPSVSSFSIDDAKKAGLWGKGGPWSQYPDRMLKMRARAFCLRDIYADVLGGLYLKEELEGIGTGNNRPQQSTIPQTLAPPAIPQNIEPPKMIEAKVEQAIIEKDVFDPVKFLDHVDETFATAQNFDELQLLFDEMVDPEWDKLKPSDQDECQGLFNKHSKRFEP